MLAPMEGQFWILSWTRSWPLWRGCTNSGGWEAIFGVSLAGRQGTPVALHAFHVFSLLGYCYPFPIATRQGWRRLVLLHG